MIKKAILSALMISCIALAACNTQEKPPKSTPVVEIPVPELENPPTPTPAPEITESPAGTPTKTPAPTPERFPEQKKQEPQKILDARQKNSEVIGWITIPNTKIDYPIVQFLEGNEKYLDLTADGKRSKAGAIFMDYRNRDKESSRHTIIYGHNMKSGSMFHDLNSFKVKEFYENNRNFSLWINGEERGYEIIGQYVVSTDINFIKTKFGSDKAFVDYAHELLQLNKFPTDIEIRPDDQILTLCTCTYEYDNSRCVVIARRIK